MRNYFRLTKSIYRPRCRADRSSTGRNALPARACLAWSSTVTVLRRSVIFCFLPFMLPRRYWAVSEQRLAINLFFYSTLASIVSRFNSKNCNLQSAKTTFFKCAENRRVASWWCEEEFEGFSCWNHCWSSIFERGGEVDGQQRVLRSNRVIFRLASL